MTRPQPESCWAPSRLSALARIPRTPAGGGRARVTHPPPRHGGHRGVRGLLHQGRHAQRRRRQRQRRAERRAAAAVRTRAGGRTDPPRPRIAAAALAAAQDSAAAWCAARRRRRRRHRAALGRACLARRDRYRRGEAVRRAGPPPSLGQDTLWLHSLARSPAALPQLHTPVLSPSRHLCQGPAPHAAPTHSGRACRLRLPRARHQAELARLRHRAAAAAAARAGMRHALLHRQASPAATPHRARQERQVPRRRAALAPRRHGRRPSGRRRGGRRRGRAAARLHVPSL